RQISSNQDAVRRGWIYCVPFSAALALGAPLASAQTPSPPPQTASASADALKQREQELEAARIEQKNSAELQARLKAEIAAIGEDRAKLNQQLIDIAARVRDV